MFGEASHLRGSVCVRFDVRFWSWVHAIGVQALGVQAIGVQAVGVQAIGVDIGLSRCLQIKNQMLTGTENVAAFKAISCNSVAVMFGLVVWLEGLRA